MSETMEQRRDTLYKRLEAGYERIATALDEGREVVEWERVWSALLAEYEGICTELAREPAAAEETARTGRGAQGQLFPESVGGRYR